MSERDALRRIVGELRELSHLEPDATSTDRAIERARAALTRTTTDPTRTARKAALMSLRNLLTAAAALVATGILGWLMLPNGSTSGIAFGEMQARVAATKTVRYVETHKVTDEQDRVGPQEERRVMVLGGSRVREEVRQTTAGDPLPEGRMWVLGPKHYVMISDYAKGKFMTLFPEDKGYVIEREVMSIDDKGNIHKEELKSLPQADFYAAIRTVPLDQANRLADREMDGRLVAVFQTVTTRKRHAGTSTYTRTYWVDPQTKLPVRIETTIRSTDPKMSDSDFVRRDIVFDAPLDEALFSTDAPAGYRDLSVAIDEKEAEPRGRE